MERNTSIVLVGKADGRGHLENAIIDEIII
jgi:hypothetical protein